MMPTAHEQQVRTQAASALPAVVLQADLRWLDEIENVHVRFQQLKSGDRLSARVYQLDKKGTQAVVLGNDIEWAASLSQNSAGSIARAAPHIAAALPGSCYFSASAGLAARVGEAWSQLHGKPAQLSAQDSCYVMHRPRLPRPKGLPLVLASELGRDKASEEMAFCWLATRNESVPVGEFSKVLGYSDALLWRQPQGLTESFRVFTDLMPSGDASSRHILMGVSCGKAEQLPFTFAHLAHQPGKVIALVDDDNQAHKKLLEETGFERRRSIKLATYWLG